MNTPRIVDVTPKQNELARTVCRRNIEATVAFCAGRLHDQPLSIKALMARLLIEDFAELDADATADWLNANALENNATHAAAFISDNSSDDFETIRQRRIDTAREQRREAFTRLAQAEIAKGQAT